MPWKLLEAVKACHWSKGATHKIVRSWQKYGTPNATKVSGKKKDKLYH